MATYPTAGRQQAGRFAFVGLPIFNLARLRPNANDAFGCKIVMFFKEVNVLSIQRIAR
jgi:hypothetical protein